MWFVAYATRVELVTKVFIARDAKIARYALPTTCLLVMISLLYGNLYLGAAAPVLVWDSLRIPDQAFPALVSLLLSPVTSAVALTGIASAAMSTTDSLLIVGITPITRPASSRALVRFFPDCAAGAATAPPARGSV